MLFRCCNISCIFWSVLYLTPIEWLLLRQRLSRFPMKPFRVALWYRKTNETQANRENTVSCFLNFLWIFCPRTSEFESYCYRNVAGILMDFYFWSQGLDFMPLYVNRLLSSKELSSKATQTFSLHPFFFLLIYITILTLEEI